MNIFGGQIDFSQVFFGWDLSLLVIAGKDTCFYSPSSKKQNDEIVVV